MSEFLNGRQSLSDAKGKKRGFFQLGLSEICSRVQTN
jgi:hypothetical protein